LACIKLHVPTSRPSLELNPDLLSLAATQAKRTAGSELRHCRGHRDRRLFIPSWDKNSLLSQI